MKNKLLLIVIFLFSSVVIVNAQIAGNWKPTGPILFPINASGQIHGIGRITQLKFHPSNPVKMYATSASGGLWISNNEAQSWQKTGTDNLPRTGCASICIDHTNDQVLYLGTGDPNYYSQGFGVWKSTNGGANWSQSNAGIGNRMAVELLMSPSNRNILVAATNDGIWKSTDAGATWTVKKSGGDFKDMIFKPVVNSTTIYAVTSTQFFRSTDMGDTWSLIALPGSGISGGGRVAVSKADPNAVYLTFVGNFASGIATPVLKSTNSGDSFVIVKAAGSPNLNGYNENESGQGNYNYSIIGDPQNANTLYVSGHCIWKSTNGGVSWTRLTSWYEKIHTDMHDFEFSPADATKLFNINDGGVWLTTNGGINWTAKSDGLETTECYHSGQSPLRKDMNYIGTQDNGELYYSNTTWYTNRGGDWNSKIEMDYQNATMAYYTENGRRRSFSQGEQAWAIPVPTGNNVELEFTPLQTNVAFVSQNDVYRTTNLTSNPPAWTKITNVNKLIKAIESSQADVNIFYAVTQDGQVLRTDNALSATPTFVTLTAPAATGARASITGIKNDANVVYITCGPKVFRSSNKGSSWTDITGTLPSINIIKIYHDPYSTDESVYIGMGTGVYYRNNTMNNWVNFSSGLPTVANITDLMMFNDGSSNSILRVSYYGRGVWESPLNSNPTILRTPENPTLSVAGLEYNYYTGTWNALPDFTTLTPVKSGTVNTFSVSERTSDVNYGFKFTGYVSVPTDGQYTFYTNTDDGSKLYIGEYVVVNNDNIHGAIEKSGTIGLKAGKHAITVTYFQGIGGQDFQVSYSGVGITKQLIPSTALFRLPTAVTCTGTGTIKREQWNNISGNSVSSIPITTTPSSTTMLSIFEGPTDVAENYGSRIGGLICAPYSGKYIFWIASDDDSELWLSTSDNPSAKIKIASLSGSVSPRIWDGNPTQKSLEITLTAGQKYYIEALQKEGVGGDNLAVGWQLPTGVLERPIPGNRLSPYVPNTAPSVNITAPTNNFTTIAPASILISAAATDNEGTVAKVEFSIGADKLGEDFSSPYSFPWNNVVAGTYLLTAKATDNQGAIATSSVITVTITATPLRNPENPVLSEEGVDYNYYTGTWTVLPDFSTLTPVKSGKVSTISLSERMSDTNYGFKFTGYVNVPTDGQYTFYTNSDDGSKLYIGDIVVVNNDNVHGAEEKSGTIGLKAGKHAITVTYFQGVGGYEFQVSYSGAAITKQLIPTTALFRVPEAISCIGSGTIRRDQWNNISGNTISSIPITTAPSSTGTLTVFEGPTDVTDNYGSRISGYICAPYTGKYTFWIASDDDSELWLSTSNDPNAKVKIASVVGYVSPRLWDGNASQKSLEITLTAGQKYYIEALQRDGIGGDHLAVGWQLPTGVLERPIPGNRLFPFIPNTPPSVSITSPVDNFTVVAPASIIINALASDNEGAIVSVEFFDGAGKLGEDFSSPYSFEWNNVFAGTYPLTVKATDSQGAVTTSAVVNVTVTGTSLRNPENPIGTVAGIDYSYYEGSWNTLPSFSTLTPVKSGTVNNYDLSVRNRSDQFGFLFKGYINVPVDGIYTFYTSSDDGSRLWIGNENILVVENNGLHAPEEKSGTIGLKAGIHTITVTFFEQGGGEVLDVSYSGPTITKQLIPTIALSRIAPVTPSINDELIIANSENSFEVAKKPSLLNYPNPYISGTTIEFNLEESGDVLVFISDYQGRKMAEVVNGYLLSGKHSYQFDSPSLVSGNYILKMITKNKEESITIMKVSRPSKAK